MKFLLKLAAAVALLSLGACAQFYSETPILSGADSVPAYGVNIGGVDLRNNPDDKTLKLRSVWKDGVYVHTATERRQDWSVKTYQIAETLAVSAATPGSFISQRAMEKEGGGVIYYYDLIRPVGDKFVTYNMACTDLQGDERARFNMVPPMPALPAGEPEAKPQPPSDCLVRSRADLEAAFALIASRKQPAGELTVKRKRRGLFGP
jgi:hypothetical protein